MSRRHLLVLVGKAARFVSCAVVLALFLAGTASVALADGGAGGTGFNGQAGGNAVASAAGGGASAEPGGPGGTTGSPNGQAGGKTMKDAMIVMRAVEAVLLFLVGCITVRAIRIVLLRQRAREVVRKKESKSLQ